MAAWWISTKTAPPIFYFMNDKTRLILLRTAALLKIVFVDELISYKDGRLEAAQLLEEIGKIIKEGEAAE
jgi:hypothetical protein